MVRIVVRHKESGMETLIRFDPPHITPTSIKAKKARRRRPMNKKIYIKDGNLTIQTIVDKCCNIFGLDTNDNKIIKQTNKKPRGKEASKEKKKNPPLDKDASFSYVLSVKLVTATGREKLVPVDLVSSLEDGDECELLYMPNQGQKRRHEMVAERDWSLEIDGKDAYMGAEKIQNEQERAEEAASNSNKSTKQKQKQNGPQKKSGAAAGVSESSRPDRGAGQKKKPPPSYPSSTVEIAPDVAAAAKKKKNFIEDNRGKVLVRHTVGTFLAVEMTPGYFYEAELMHFKYKGKIHWTFPTNYDPNSDSVLYSMLHFKAARNEHGNLRKDHFDLRHSRHFVVTDKTTDDGDDDNVPEFVMIPRTIDDENIGYDKDKSIPLKLLEGEGDSNSKKSTAARDHRKTNNSNNQLPQIGDNVSVMWGLTYKGEISKTRWMKNFGADDGESSRFFVFVNYWEIDDWAWSIYDGPGSRKRRHAYVKNSSPRTYPVRRMATREDGNKKNKNNNDENDNEPLSIAAKEYVIEKIEEMVESESKALDIVDIVRKFEQNVDAEPFDFDFEKLNNRTQRKLYDYAMQNETSPKKNYYRTTRNTTNYTDEETEPDKSPASNDSKRRADDTASSRNKKGSRRSSGMSDSSTTDDELEKKFRKHCSEL